MITATTLVASDLPCSTTLCSASSAMSPSSFTATGIRDV